MFVVKNKELFKLNSNILGFSTRYDNDFHLPSEKLNLLYQIPWKSLTGNE
jgi:hypothetical protein